MKEKQYTVTLIKGMFVGSFGVNKFSVFILNSKSNDKNSLFYVGIKIKYATQYESTYWKTIFGRLLRLQIGKKYGVFVVDVMLLFKCPEFACSHPIGRVLRPTAHQDTQYHRLIDLRQNGHRPAIQKVNK